MPGIVKRPSNKKTSVSVLSRFERSAEFGILIPLIVIIAITSVINRNFLTLTNFTTILKILPFNAIATLGISFVLLTGNIDISIGRIAGLSGMVFPYCMMVLKLNPVTSLFIALLIGTLIGLVNGFLVVVVGIPDFVATIGTLYAAGGARFLLTKGYPLSPLPFGIGKIGDAKPLGLSWPLIFAVILFIIVEFVLKKTLFGRRLLATGDNREVAALAGINVKRMRMTAYSISGFFAAVAGVLLTIDLDNGMPQNGDGWEFKAIASCAVGGVSLTGGKGSSLGVAIGVLIIFIVDNSLVMIGVPSAIQKSVTGIILGGAVMFDIAKQRKKIKG